VIDANVWDVIVVGAGPAGAMAALRAAQNGAQVLLLERERLPRYKLCGGGLIGLTLQSLPNGFNVPSLNEAKSATFTMNLAAERTRTAEEVIIPMVMRDTFDAQLVDFAVEHGVQLRTEVLVERVDPGPDEVTVLTSGGPLRARVVIGADGSTSRVARAAGAKFAQVDLGLEVEVEVPDRIQQLWAGRVLIDFGRIPGGYAWIFPKGDRLTVGAIAAKGYAQEQRRYVQDMLRRFELELYPQAVAAGHLTRCRTNDSPLAADRLLLAGDAAGLLEPWTREGISFALRSGRLAGEAAADVACGRQTWSAAATHYRDAITDNLGAEMTVGFRALAAYERHPSAFARALAGTGPGWRSFVRLARGETTLARAGRRPQVRLALAALAR